jgi:hypothetical protein
MFNNLGMAARCAAVVRNSFIAVSLSHQVKVQ